MYGFQQISKIYWSNSADGSSQHVGSSGVEDSVRCVHSQQSEKHCCKKASGCLLYCECLSDSHVYFQTDCLQWKWKVHHKIFWWIIVFVISIVRTFSRHTHIKKELWKPQMWSSVGVCTSADESVARGGRGLCDASLQNYFRFNRRSWFAEPKLRCWKNNRIF